MPGLTEKSKELEEDGKEIEKDPILSELDNSAAEEGLQLDNEVPETESDLQNLTKPESNDVDEGEKEEEPPEINREGNTLTAEGGITVDVNHASGDTETGGPEPGIFDTKTGVSMASDIMKGLGNSSSEQENIESPAAGTSDILDSGMKTGASQGFSKKKLFLFKAISGLKKAKKSVGNFFTKKLPAAFKTGGTAAMKILRKTPLSPIFAIYDKVAEYRERTRPERELKAEKKKEEKTRKKELWLLGQDEKRRQKEEAKRLKKEQEEEAAREKAELEKINGPNKAKVFFKTIWGGIKTGAKWLWKKIKDYTLNYSLPFTDVTVGDSLRMIKKGVLYAKDKITNAISYVMTEIDQLKDEYDEYSFEERMQKVSQEESEKRKRGEDVPQDDYRTRYLALTEELKGKLAPIRSNIKRREDIEAELAEMEGHKAPSAGAGGTGSQAGEPDGGKAPSEEPGGSVGGDITRLVRDEVEWQAVGSVTRDADISNLVFTGIGQTNWVTGFVKKAIVGAGVVRIVSSLGQIGSQAAKLDTYRKRAELMDAINATADDELMQRVSKYAKNNAELQEMEAGFNIAISALNAGRGIGEITGMGPMATGFKVARWVTTGIKMLATASKKRSGVKAGIKDMLGGPEGYYKLKDKYKMHAPEMRRAVRDALGVATSEDAVTADKWELSHLMSERAKAGDKSANMERMIAEAGGATEKRFDALQGAGTKIRHRNANRGLRMTA